MTAELLRLAERCEKETAGSRELDGLIACAIFQAVSTDDDLIYRSPICKADECAPGTYWHVQRSGRSLQTAPKFTESLDAAVSSIPGGYDWSLFFDNGAALAGCQPASDDGCDMTDTPGATPALALTAAALKARALASRDDGHQETAHD